MASGTIIGTKTGNFGVEIDWVATPNTATNTSTVVSKIYITYASISMGARTVTSTINGTAATFTSAKVEDYPNTQVRRLLCTHTLSVQHGTDGTKNGVTISASVPFKITSSVHGYIDTLTASKAVNFDPIPRASELTLATTTPTTGSTFKATITKADSNFRHRLEFIINGVSKQTTDYFTGTEYSCKIEHSWIPAAPSLPGIVRLYTYTKDSASYIGYKDVPITANVDSSLKPTVSLTSALASGGLNGYYMQGKSKAKLTATASAGNGSYITSYVFTGPNVDADSTSSYFSVASSATTYTLTTDILKEANAQTYQVTVYDARGRYSSASVNITIQPYVAPEILSFSVQRCTSGNVLSKDGTYVRYTINSKFSPTIIGTTINNPRTIKMYYSDDGGASYKNEKTIVLATNTDMTATGVYGDGLISTTKPYRFKVVIEETSGYKTSNPAYADLGSVERPLNIAKYGNGVAIGGISSIETQTSEGLFECNWDAKFTDDVVVDGNMDIKGTIHNPTILGQVIHAGNGSTWVAGRNNAALRVTTGDTDSYVPTLSAKSSTGTWDIGTYQDDNLYFTFISDTNYNSNNNETTVQYAMGKYGNFGISGSFYEGGTLLANKYAAKSHYHGYSRVLGWTTLSNNASVNFTVNQLYGLIIVHMYINSDGYAATVVDDGMLGQPMTISYGSSNYGFILSRSGTTFTLKRNGSASVSYVVDVL